MTREEFIEFLKERDIPFTEYTENGLDQVYVFSRRAYMLKTKYPRRYKNLYVPYLRVSNFNGEWYTRQDGWCEYMPVCNVLKICRELGA